jgi:hypothetical protein
MALCDTFLFSSPLILFSFPVSLVFADLLPIGLPRITPSAFFLANASFVRCEIRFLYISAERPNAKASTLEMMSLPKR